MPHPSPPSDERTGTMTDITITPDTRPRGSPGVPTDWPSNRHVLLCEQVLPRGLDEVYRFFADARNLDQLTPASLRFRIVTATPIDMHAGTLIDYSIRLRGVTMRWRTRISVWEPGKRFVDEQLRGPYALWHHEHVFEEVDGGTRVRDRVTYAVGPAWLPGADVVNRVFIKPELLKILGFRRAQMERLFR